MMILTLVTGLRSHKGIAYSAQTCFIPPRTRTSQTTCLNASETKGGTVLVFAGVDLFFSGFTVRPFSGTFS